ncbi:AraC family transcriptional regulator [Cohnella zeiphila]|uniref:AraC family transcriptional regulator n=1 Tax=Cohnella zeiphila TaxID=2761120 RepID=UPI003080E1B6
MLREYEYEFAEFLYYTPGDLDKESGLWPVRGGRTLAKPNYRVGPKRIECWSLHLVREGRVRLEFDGGTADLGAGDLFCLFPDRAYTYFKPPEDSALRMSWLALDGQRVEPLLARIGMTPDKPYLGKPSPDGRIHEAAELAIEALANADQGQPASALELQALVGALFAELLRRTGTDSGKADTADWIKQCRSFMDLHATEGITVRQVADLAGVHRSYFSNEFTRQTGISPVKYLQRIRMEKAVRLLKDTDATVTEIALSLGYPNLHSFTRAFKMYYEASPLAVRQDGDGRRRFR